MKRRDWLKGVFGVLVGSSTIASLARRTLAQAPSQPQPEHLPVFGAAVSGLRLGLVVYNALAIELVLENVSSAPITVLSHVDVGIPHLDWFRLELTPLGGTGTARTLRFMEAREHATRITRTIAPHASFRHVLDMGHWTAAAVNSVPTRVPNGNYTLTAVYDTTAEHEQWRGRIVSGSVQSPIQT